MRNDQERFKDIQEAINKFNLKLIWRIVEQELPTLKQQINSILQE